MSEDGEWTLAAKDYANTRYSGLDQINTGMKQTVAAVEQTVSSATGLKDTAAQLQEMVVR